jgi:thioredoxin-related protein
MAFTFGDQSNAPAPKSNDVLPTKEAIANDIWVRPEDASNYGQKSAGFTLDDSWKKYILPDGTKDVQLNMEPVQAKPIEFSNALYDSFLKASKEGKPLIVEFSQESCGWCKKLNEETLKSPEVTALGDKAVWVRVDPMKDEDDKGNVRQLQADLKVDKFPTVVVLDVTPQGIRERGRIVGYFKPADFSNNLKQLLPPAGSQPQAQDALVA